MSSFMQTESAVGISEIESPEAQEVEGGDKFSEVAGEASVLERRERLLARVRELADEIAARPSQGSRHAPLEELARLAETGAFTAALPSRYNGLGLGSESGGHSQLLQLLAAVGGADLVLGRLFEGHVNALLLVVSFGTEQQIARAAREAADGLLFGVWNTGERELLRLAETAEGYRFEGAKTFASGAAFVQRPVVTAQRPEGWQMTVIPMDAVAVRDAIVLDRGSWEPLGMEGSESYRVNFTGAVISADELLGGPEDFYRDPLFRGGAVRFAAVHAGGVLRLYRLFTDWLERSGRGEDPYQVARLGEIAIRAQECVLWIERAAALSEEGMFVGADKLAAERMVECAGMTRVAIERAATDVMQRVVEGVGAHGLLRPHPFEEIVRNLTMYLRQPAPDQTLAEVGRTSLRRNRLRAGGAEGEMWLAKAGTGSMPATYFEQLYATARDPWDFEASEYEAEKYRTTLASLPRDHYKHALEIGCSIGVLTKKLAGRCSSLLSIDVSERALAEARARCAELPQVKFAKVQIPREIPEGEFDLIVLSEVGYYLQKDDLHRTAHELAKHQRAGSDLVLVHFTPVVPDYPMTGDQVHEAWLTHPEWEHTHGERHDRYRLDVLRRR